VAVTPTPALLAFCEADRTALLSRAGAPPDAVPSSWLDTIIEDVLAIGLATQPLRGKLLGLCDYDRRRIVINSRMAQVTLPNTYLDGLVHSTKAHELAHLRFLYHETEVRQAACHGENPVKRAEELREFEANYYAGVFLVPSDRLAQEPEAGTLREAAQHPHPLSSDELWVMAVAIGRRYQVTGSLMATRLAHLGLVVKEARTLHLPSP
jgi:Zn-dependent peptidase ImmA (M78 family)